MSNPSYFNALSATISDAQIAKKGGLAYIAAATAMHLAGRPEVTYVDFADGNPFLKCLDGALVAVDIPVPGTDAVQRMWLPVMDQDNYAVPFDRITATDVNNSRQRCLVKAIAATLGVGMSVYLNCDGDGAKAAKMLKVNPDTDLAEVEPVVATLKQGGAPYIEWNVGLAACRITDPGFHWGVVTWGNELPFREVLGGLMVDVDTVYRGKRQRMSLPVMDAAFKPFAADKASVLDWNKTVMRALTKNIAYNSGYGLLVYAEDLKAETGVDAAAKGKPGKGTSKSSEAKQEPANAEASAKPEAPATAEQPKAEATATPAPVAAPAAAEAPAATPAPAPAPAPAAAAPAPAPAEGKPAAAPTADCITRFQGVMNKRRDGAGVAGLITLFEALATSDKYKPEEKPLCYAVLVPAVAAATTQKEIASVVANIKTYTAMQYLAQDARDLVAGRLTATALEEACARGDEALLAAPAELVDAGIAADVEDVFRLAKQGNTAEETLSLLRQLVVIEESMAT